MKLRINLFLLFVFVTLMPLSNCLASADALEPVAWIELVNPVDALTPRDPLAKPKIVIFRQGKPLAISGSPIMTELRSGDRIQINDEHAYINLVSTSGNRLRVTNADMARKNGGYEINVHSNSLWNNLVALVTDNIKPGQIQVVNASIRGIADLSIPADQTEEPKLAASERALHFRWQGGEPPYSLTIVRDDKVIMAIKIPQGYEATLPKQYLPPGNYRLILKDKTGLASNVDPLYGDAYEITNLILVSPADIPSMPLPLADIPLPEEFRQLLYADWLARQGRGQWRMEAIQHVFPYAKDYQPAADWLLQWGGT